MLELSWSGHLDKFKNLLGHTNLYLTTILIGLEGVRTGKVTKDECFKVTWNPESIEDCVVRSRRFARCAALAWAIDALDAYLIYLRKKPFEFNDIEFSKILSENSVYNKLNAVITFCNYKLDLPLSIIHLGIQWRNNVVHFHAKNELDFAYKSFLRNVKIEKEPKRFRGLDVQEMLQHFDAQQLPTRKEVAAIIQSIHFVVLEIDKSLKKYVNLQDYCFQLISENAIEFNKIIRTAPDKRLKKTIQFFISKGYKPSMNLDLENRITEMEISKIIEHVVDVNNLK